MTRTQARTIYQLKITLTGAKPPIWRRVQVSSDMPLDQFHLTIQLAMGWTNSHLHQFISNNVFYGIKNDDLDFGMDIEDEKSYQLNQLLKSEKATLIYEYDFGDSWEHQILLEKILPFNTETTLPKCIKGKRACPPEDCGGIWGYKELIETLSDPEDPEYDSTQEWLGGKFDPESFSIKEINKLLSENIS